MNPRSRASVVALGSALVIGATAFTAGAQAGTTHSGSISTTEFYYKHPAPLEVVTISAYHWGARHAVAYRIWTRSGSSLIAAGNILLSGGAGQTEVNGLAGGRYKLVYQRADGSSATVYFSVNCDHTC